MISTENRHMVDTIATIDRVIVNPYAYVDAPDTYGTETDTYL